LEGPENRTFSEEIKRDFEGAEKFKKAISPPRKRLRLQNVG
jgi:hypothetical protein